MPWKVEQRGDKHCVIKQSDGSTVHCHDTREQAMAQLRALYASEGKSFTYLDLESEGQPPMDESNDALVFYGGAVKALGDGRVGGYGVLFTTADDPDLQGDFFTKSTDLELDGRESLLAIWDHGLDPVMKKRKLGRAKYEVQDVGVWFETRLNESDDYEKAIYGLAKAGKLGWSTGSAPHLVERVPVKKAFELKSWPIIEVSLTHMPVEPRTAAIPLKSVNHADLKSLLEDDKESPDPVIDFSKFSTKALEDALSAAYNNDLDTHSLKVATAVEELIAHYVKAATALDVLSGRMARKQEFRAVKDGRSLSKRRIDKVNELISQLKKLAEHPLSIAAEFEKMVKEATATQEQRDALHEAIQLQHNTFQQLKETQNV